METSIITRHDCLGYVCIEGRGRRNEDDGEERETEQGTGREKEREERYFSPLSFFISCSHFFLVVRSWRSICRRHSLSNIRLRIGETND